MKWTRTHLSFANAISLIALFVALGGTGYAATQLSKNSVGAKQIKKNAVGAPEVKRNAVRASEIRSNAVGGADILDNGVGAADLADNSVGAGELGDNSVGAGELGNNSVGSGEVTDDSLTATDIVGATLDGRFAILHRDHGWPDGWAEPTLHSGHVPLFTNGTQQPVVFGINCSSAAFDNPAHPSFVELQVLRPDGGAIAGFGDTRVSPSFPNNHMALGFFDALFPSTVADYGGPETRRLGDVLIRGKQYMATQEGFEWHGAGDTYVEHYLYHLLGDPTMQMWADPPQRFDPSRFRAVVREWREFDPTPDPGDPPFFVRFEFPGEPLAVGALVTVFRGAEAIGRGVVGADGTVDVPPDAPFSEKDKLTVSMQTAWAFPAAEPVEGAATGLTANCAPDGQLNSQPMTTTGRLTAGQAGIAGATVKVNYKAPNGESFDRNVVTDANGNWSDTFAPASLVPNDPNRGHGTWTVQASYAGSETLAPSQSPPCTVDVVDNF